MIKILRIFILFLLSLNLCAADPKLLGSAHLDSLMGVTEDFGRLAERVYPGSSLMLVMGLTALSFDPKFKDFDLAAPISAYLYSMEGDKKENMEEWCVAFKKKSDKLPATINFGKETAYIKDVQGRAVFSFSKNLIDAVTELPAPPSEKKQMTVSINVTDLLKYSKDTIPEIKRDLLKSLLNSRSVPENTDINALKSFQIKLDYIEDSLRQLEKLDMSVSFTADGISMKLLLVPLKKSPFENFVLAQAAHEKKLAPLFSEKMVAASGSLAVTEAMRNGLVSLIKDIALETAEDEKNIKYSELLAFAVKNSSGRFSYYSDINGDFPLSYFKLFCGTPEVKDFTASVSKFSDMKTENPRLYKLYSFKAMGDTVNLFSYIEDQDIIFLNGSIENKDALDAVNEKCELSPVPEKYAGASLIITDNSVTEAGSEIVLFFKKEGVALEMTVSPESVRNYLPKDLLKKSDKKGGKKGIKIKSGSFSD